MRFHRLKIKNINSLYENQEIDFDALVANDPLFLIMGPTGSGKTTILDAICLALFGTTPRQRGERSSKAVAEKILSRGEGEAQVILEFSRRDEARGGRVRYRAQWSCWRANKRADGNMQDPRRSLDRVEDSGKVTTLVANTEKQKDYEPVFTEALQSMGLDDFLRSVLLAQGQFTAFLEADADTKATILERLTNTYDYKEVGQRAADRYRAKRVEKERLEKQIEQVDVRTEAAFQELREAYAQAQKEQAKLKKSEERARARLHWATEYEEIQGQIEEAEEGLQEVKKEDEAHQEDWARLERAERARIPGKFLEARDELQGEIDEKEGRRDALREKLEGLGAKIEAAEEALKKAAAQEEKERKALEGAAQELKEARRLDQSLNEKAKAVLEAKEGQKEAKEGLEALAGALERARERVKALDEAVAANQERLQTYQEHLGLPEEISGLKERGESIEREVASLEVAREGLKEDEARLKEWVEKERLQREELETAREVLEGFLPWRRETLEGDLARIEERLAVQGRLGETLERVESIDQAVESGRRECEALKTELKKEEERLGAKEKELEHQEERLEDREKIARLHEEKVHLATFRERLSGGEPCPVCGSEEHPYRGRSVEEFDAEAKAAQAALQATREMVEGLKKEVQALQISVHGQGAALREKQKGLEEKEGDAARLKSDLARGWEVLFEEGLPDAGPEDLRARLKTVGAELAERQVSLKAFEKAAQKEERLRVDFQHCVERLGEARKRYEKVSGEVAARAEALKKEQAELKARLKGFGVESLGEAVRLAEAVKEAREQSEALAKKHREEGAERDRLETLLPEREEDVAKAAEKIEALEKEETALKAAREEIFGGQSADEVERELKEALLASENVRKEKEKALRGWQQEKVEVSTSLKGVEEALTERRLKWEAARAELAKTMEEAEFLSVEALRAAMLGEEALKALSGLRQKVRDAMTSAKGRVEEAKRRLRGHQEERGALFAEGEAATVEALEASAEARSGELQALNERCGALGNEIEHEEEKREKAGAWEKALEVAKEEFQRWKVIHELIGVNDGEYFKLAAQALNLEKIVAHANVHLQQLRERFKLAVKRDVDGHPLLEFAIIDTHQGDRVREISTLSGGESFLVSLALALGMANFRSVKMPVETLFLDEGFGTLDQEALQEAVQVLATLQSRENRQVGVISHVESLQEQIEDRIVVEPLSGGRSRVRVEIGDAIFAAE